MRVYLNNEDLLEARIERLEQENAELRKERQEMDEINESEAAIAADTIKCLKIENTALRADKDRLFDALDTLTLVIGLTPVAGNKAALQEAFDKARAAIDAARKETE